jgi:hypothetical protein
MFRGGDIMTNARLLFISIVRRNLPALAFTLTLVCVPAMVAQPANVQTYVVLHSFSGGVDGSSPFAGLIGAAVDGARLCAAEVCI